jgi:CAAD domains of cyanobacterial aminoacyl-tRNA synthetase
MESQESTQKELQNIGLGTTTGGQMVKPSSDRPWQEWIAPVMEVVEKVPNYIGQFFADYRQPLIYLGLLALGIVTVKVTLAVLDAVDDIPLLSPLLELVGIGYTAWFVWRYLLKSETRRELISEFEAIKTQVFGDRA